MRICLCKLLHFPDVVGLEEFGEVMILLCCLNFLYLLVDGIVVGYLPHPGINQAQLKSQSRPAGSNVAAGTTLKIEVDTNQSSTEGQCDGEFCDPDAID